MLGLRVGKGGKSEEEESRRRFRWLGLLACSASGVGSVCFAASLVVDLASCWGWKASL